MLLKRLIIKALGIIYYFRYSLNYNEKYYETEQDKKFEKYDLDRKAGLTKLNELKNQFKFLNKPMSSEHQVLFSSLSLNKKINFKRILEIGTFDGSNAFLLSKLFPSARIITLDLEDNNEKFRQTYNRETDEKLKNFCKERNEILKQRDNISFLQKDSIQLISSNEKFDLIWIDGAHGYPVVTIDIINSLRLCDNEGFIMCDDIYTNKIYNADDMYISGASYETLSVLKDLDFINFELFFKRLTKEYNSIPTKRQFVGLIKKNYKNFISNGNR